MAEEKKQEQENPTGELKHRPAKVRKAQEAQSKALPALEDVQTAIFAKLASSIDAERHTKSLAEAWDNYIKNTVDPWHSLYLNPAKGSNVSLFLSSFEPNYRDLQTEIAKLYSDIGERTKDLLSEEPDENKERKIQELTKSLQDLRDKQSLSHLLSRVGTAAQSKLLSDPEFRKRFKNDEPCNAFVVSIDIRRSTELMLKARKPRLFAEFITTLAAKLRDVILESYGVFDKFTGDGILAFYPEFYSGDDAGFRAIDAASRCHEIFAEHYDANRHCFISILRDTGLGVGVDFGQVQLVEIGGDFTVVGTPVVYACRMAGAPAKQTYVNQPAYEELFAKYSAFDFESTALELKHEGSTLAYNVRPNGKSFEPKQPEWVGPTPTLSPTEK